MNSNNDQISENASIVVNLQIEISSFKTDEDVDVIKENFVKGKLKKKIMILF